MNDANNNMNIRRFVAENSRAALRQVRDALGGDAIILSNRSVDGGVEILAAAAEAVDALTRSIAPAAPSAAAIPTPTELGLKAPVPVAPAARRGFASLFGRRAAADTAAADALPDLVPPVEALPRAAAPSNATTRAAAKAATSYLSFADELIAADGGAPDADVVTHFASQAPRPPVAEPLPPAPSIGAAAMRTPVAEVAKIDEVALADAVAREVRSEIGRELGRDVINDLTLDVSREVTQAVSGEVSREVTREVTRDVTRDVSRDVTRDVSAAVTTQVAKELRAMQATLTDQLATLAWTDSMRRQPGRTRLMQDLVVAGFSPALARHIQSRLPDDFAAAEAGDWVKSILQRNLPVASDAESLIDEGGVYALVGPTGVGKTTTVAKLAARFALRHGVEQLALITTDGFRVGAQDQLRIYGKILGIGVQSIHDESSLTSAIDQLRHRRLVLIDTAGMSQRDDRVAEQIAMLRGVQARRLVVLNATSDAETLDHVVARFADRDFLGCVITKTDEAARLGPVLDVVIRHRLRIHHVSTGQKVPEDLERPDAAALVERALERPVGASAFTVHGDDEASWMSAMSARATTLAPGVDAALLAAQAGEVDGEGRRV